MSELSVLVLLGNVQLNIHEYALHNEANYTTVMTYVVIVLKQWTLTLKIKFIFLLQCWCLFHRIIIHCSTAIDCVLHLLLVVYVKRSAFRSCSLLLHYLRKVSLSKVFSKA